MFSEYLAALIQFLGMTIPLHVILIHFPIVLLSLTSVTAGARFFWTRSTSLSILFNTLLPLGALGAIAAATTGFLLETPFSGAEGLAGQAYQWHKTLGIGIAGLSTLTAILNGLGLWKKDAVALKICQWVSVFFLPLVLLTAHLGGLMVQVLEI